MRKLSQAEISLYRADGYVRLPGFFSAAEIEPLRSACHAATLGGALMALA